MKNNYRYRVVARENDMFYGCLYRNKPTPSGFIRPILAISDNRRFPTVKEAHKQFTKLLKENKIPYDDKSIIGKIINLYT